MSAVFRHKSGVDIQRVNSYPASKRLSSDELDGVPQKHQSAAIQQTKTDTAELLKTSHRR